jgi:hypothetical protein
MPNSRSHHTRPSLLIPILLLIALLGSATLACRAYDTIREALREAFGVSITASENQIEDDSQQGSDGDQGDLDDAADDDDLPSLPQIPEPLVFTDDIGDAVCCNACDWMPGVTLPTDIDLSTITFLYVIEDEQCYGDFVLEFGQPGALSMPHTGYLTWYDPAQPLPPDDLYCWGRYGNYSYWYVYDGMSVTPYYSVVDPQTLNWGPGDLSGYDAWLDTTTITYRIPCEQIDPDIPWMAHIMPPPEFPCESMGQATTYEPVFLLFSIDY